MAKESSDSAVDLAQLEASLSLQRNCSVPSLDAIHQALQCDATARRILAKEVFPQDAELVGVRLNINVLNKTGVAVHSIHRATSKDGHTKGRGFYRGEVINYLPVVVLREAFFNVQQSGREGIAIGSVSKFPMASIDGAFVHLSDTDVDFSGVECSFNPKTTHLFIDSQHFAVRYAQEVTILGHRAYARGVEYFTESSAPARTGCAPSIAKFKPR